MNDLQPDVPDAIPYTYYEIRVTFWPGDFGGNHAVVGRLRLEKLAALLEHPAWRMDLRHIAATGDERTLDVAVRFRAFSDRKSVV